MSFINDVQTMNFDSLVKRHRDIAAKSNKSFEDNGQLYVIEQEIFRRDKHKDTLINEGEKRIDGLERAYNKLKDESKTQLSKKKSTYSKKPCVKYERTIEGVPASYIKKFFAGNLKLHMDKNGFSAKDFSAATGISAWSIYQYCQAKYLPNDTNINIIADTLGISRGELLCTDTDK